MKHTAIALLVLVFAAGTVLAAPAAPTKTSAKKPVATADQKTMAAEEKDRLAREKKELEERAAQLSAQLQTSQKLVTEKDAYLKQLQQEIAKLKSGK